MGHCWEQLGVLFFREHKHPGVDLCFPADDSPGSKNQRVQRRLLVLTGSWGLALVGAGMWGEERVWEEKRGQDVHWTP